MIGWLRRLLRRRPMPHLCTCMLHDGPELCSPTRGHFNCAGRYVMPRLPEGTICVLRMQIKRRSDA